LSALKFHDECILIQNFVLSFAKFAMHLHAQADQLKDLFLIKQFVHG